MELTNSETCNHKSDGEKPNATLTVCPGKSIIKELTDFVGFANLNGYEISQDAVTSLLSFIGLYDVKPSELEVIEPYMRTFFVHDAVQDKQFKKLIAAYKSQKGFETEAEWVRDLQKQRTKENAIKQLNIEKESMERTRDQFYDSIEETSQRIKDLESSVLEHSKEYDAIKPEKSIDEKGLKKFEKSLQSVKEEYENTLKQTNVDSATKERLKTLHTDALNEAAPYSEKDMNKMENAARKALRWALPQEHAKEVMDILLKQIDLLKKMRKSIDVAEEKKSSYTKERKELEQAKRSKVEFQTRLDNLLLRLDKQEKTIQKEESSFHRDAFIEDYYHYSVKASGVNPEKIPDKTFKNMTSAEREMLKRYIRQNARQFKTRMTRNINSGLKRNLDFHETIKKACQTGGIPLRLHYEKPAAHKAKLILMLDISGSCRAASELMLNFMYYMQEVFPGGCKTYVFTNQLYDISGIMQVKNGEDAIEEVLSTVPTRGVYSDYYKPLTQFYEEHMSEVTKDSIVMFIGDARNNKNQSGEEYVKAISRKAKHAYWMNTDVKEKWNQGDSIIGKYEPYMKRCNEVRTPLALISFLMDIR